MARFDLARLVEAFRRVAGDEVADLAGRRYGGSALPAEQWARVFAVFGPHIPPEDQLARRVQNLSLGEPGMALLRRLDVVAELKRITCPTLVCTGDLDPVTPIEAAREIVDALPPGLGQLEVVEGAGHFPWLDRPDRYWSMIRRFPANGRQG